ncbi:MAG TPA: GNAT family N-acetyltransferase [Gammaproteobacteria bacterium]|nr:GNAT family N-acetyltransferase [Gammaproteobacteria bacterium]|tara:strand:+ start:1549 stop:1992 length:444 start_codon:yes stop_codon:yes gene_type:complete
MPAINVIHTRWTEPNKSKLAAIRLKVFVEEQRVPVAEEWDGADPDCEHFLAFTETGHCPGIGCARLMPSGQIGRMAVLIEHREHGIGRLLLDAAVAKARELGMAEVFLHAQRHAEGFYAKAGFKPYGEEFLDANIPHIAMRLSPHHD